MLLKHLICIFSVQVAKALLLRYHPLSTVLTDKVKDCFLLTLLFTFIFHGFHVRMIYFSLCLICSQLFALLSDPELGSKVADGFCVLMSDSPDVLNRNCHADVRIMYRQRFFAENSTKLVQGFNSAEQGTTRLPLSVLSISVYELLDVPLPEQYLKCIFCLTEKKSCYLKALSHIVNNLPRQVQLTELPAVSASE